MKKYLLLLCLLIASPVQAAITFFGQAHIPATNPGTQNGATCSGTPIAITPPGSMLANDYVLLIAIFDTALSTPITLSISNTGGQTWTSETQRNKDNDEGFGVSTRLFHARFNGTWSANPSIGCSDDSADALSFEMLVFRGVNTTTALDVNPVCAAFDDDGSGASDITIAAITTNTNNAMAIAFWTNGDDTAGWSLQTGGWSQQQTSWHNTSGDDNMISHAYKIQATAGTTGDVVNRQAQGKDGVTCILALKEQSTTRPSIAPIIFQ